MLQVRFVTIFIILIITASSVAADTIIVDDNWDTDHTTIQAAIDAANNGDIILVYPGNYTENIKVNKELTIISKSGNPEDTIVHAADSKKDVFRVTANNVTISGFKIGGARVGRYSEDDRAGILLEGVRDGLVTNNNVSLNTIGIILVDSDNNTLKNNDVSYNRLKGIWLWESSNNILQNNTAIDDNHEGILLWMWCRNNEIINNTVSNNGFGIAVEWHSDNNRIYNNVALNGFVGIFLSNSNHNSIVNNIANSNDWAGIDLQRSNSSILLNNTANSNNNHGVFLIGSNYNNLENNNASNNLQYGININNSSTNNVLRNNIANSNGKEDIHITNPENNTMDGSGIPGLSVAGTFAVMVGAVLMARGRRKK